MGPPEEHLNAALKIYSSVWTDVPAAERHRQERYKEERQTNTFLVFTALIDNKRNLFWHQHDPGHVNFHFSLILLELPPPFSSPLIFICLSFHFPLPLFNHVLFVSPSCTHTHTSSQFNKQPNKLTSSFSSRRCAATSNTWLQFTATHTHTLSNLPVTLLTPHMFPRGVNQGDAAWTRRPLSLIICAWMCVCE